MTKTLTYSGLAVAVLFMILLFVTSKSYTQLIVAIALYPVIGYFALKSFPRKASVKTVTVKLHTKKEPQHAHVVEEREKVDVADVDKRTFLKFVGATGLSFFIFSLLGKRTETLLFNGALESKINNLGSPTIAEVSPSDQSAPEGYKIAEIDDDVISYYGFTNKNGSWLIMREDTNTNSFRYTKGDGNFANGWERRQDLNYDYYYNLFQ